MFPLFRIFVRMPLNTGMAIFCSLRKSIAQLIIGQLMGIKTCTNQEIKSWHRQNVLDTNTTIAQYVGRNQTHARESDTEVANMVMTRSATRKHQQILQKEQQDQQRITTHNTIHTL